MNTKTRAVYNKIVETLGDEAAKLSRPEYIELVKELAGHIECLEECIREESGDES